MKVLWTHNFNTDRDRNAGVFMFTAAKGLEDLGVKVVLEFLGDLRSPLKIFKAQDRARRMSREFDLVHAQYGSACALATSIVGNCPKVVTLRGNDWDVYSSSFEFHYWHTRLARELTKLSLGAFDLAISVSNRMASEVSRRYPEVPSVAIPSPINLKRFIPVDKRLARESLGFPDNDEKWVLFTSVDMACAIKRYSLAKEAVDLANAELGDVSIRLANGLPHSKIPVFVAACDLILCTSETEGWPNSVKEALACNLPFVSTDVSDLHTIAEREPSCRICPPDATILAENICEVLSTPRTGNLRRHVAEMDLGVTSERLLSLYSGLVARRKMS